MSTMIEGATFLRRNLRDEDGTSYHGVGVYRVATVVTTGEASSLHAVRLALFTALRADNTLNTALRAPTLGDGTSKRVFHDQAQTGTPLNYITLGDGAESEGDTTAYERVGVDSEIVFDIWGIVSTSLVSPPPVGRYGVEVLYAHCARVLHGKKLVLTS